MNFDAVPVWLLWLAAAAYEVWLVWQATRWKLQPLLSGWLRPAALPVAIAGLAMNSTLIFTCGFVAFVGGAILDAIWRTRHDRLDPPTPRSGDPTKL
ncbi:hypothetical protein JOD67_001570 [Tenggerimyces flavus]|nr:hypothetical protein [Tenggerimyces flavus]